jgi:hypothetical protein
MTSGTMRLCHCIFSHPSIVFSVIAPLYCLSSFHCIVYHPSICDFRLSFGMFTYFSEKRIAMTQDARVNWWIPATFDACSKPDPWFSTWYVVVFFVISEFSEGETRVVDISCVDERHCLILFCHSCVLYWEMSEHTKSLFKSHIWPKPRILKIFHIIVQK